MNFNYFINLIYLFSIFICVINCLNDTNLEENNENPEEPPPTSPPPSPSPPPSSTNIQLSKKNTDETEFILECFKFIYERVKDAGVIFRKGFYESTKKIEEKTSSWDLVTEYDKKIEALLMDEIKKKYKNHKFIAEETATDLSNLTDEPTWIIDPIDGTTNYIHGVPLTAISIAMSLNKELVLGIVYNPILNEFFATMKGRGAYLNGDRIYTSNVNKLEKAVYAHESSFIRDENVREKNAKRTYYFASRAQSFRSIGTGALTLAYIAKGIFDGYILDDLYPWDISAGALLIKEAGGCTYNIDGSQFNFIKSTIIAGSSESLCQELIKGVREADALTLVVNDKKKNK